MALKTYHFLEFIFDFLYEVQNDYQRSSEKSFFVDFKPRSYSEKNNSQICLIIVKRSYFWNFNCGFVDDIGLKKSVKIQI